MAIKRMSGYARVVDPLCPHTRAPTQPLGASPQPALTQGMPVPRDAQAAHQLAAMFMAQMEATLASIGDVDPSEQDGSGSSESGSDAFGSLDPLAGQSLLGTGAAGLLSLLGGGLASSVAGASLGSDLLATPAGAAMGADTPRNNARIVAAEAASHGVDPRLAVAVMLVESGGNHQAVGDGGTSFGLFQLHEGGMLTAAGLSPGQAMDPATNARVALASLARTARQMPHASPGEIAAASQRPADRTAYAARVNAAYADASVLLGG